MSNDGVTSTRKFFMPVWNYELWWCYKHTQIFHACMELWVMMVLQAHAIFLCLYGIMSNDGVTSKRDGVTSKQDGVTSKWGHEYNYNC